MYETKILKDSIAPCGKRITTWELTYPRFVHAELMTHRLFSRNSASSRAIPNEKLRQRIKDDPVFPKFWGRNQAGMQAQSELEGEQLAQVKACWLKARDAMLDASSVLAELGLHKQLANRLLEPWMFITVILTATEFDNWYHLRDSPFAQPEIAWVARDMRAKHEASVPEMLSTGEWHVPLVETRDSNHPLFVDPANVCASMGAYDASVLLKIATARCARVSYLTHDGVRDFAKDVELHDQLAKNGHWSPFEHCAQALDTPARHGNFVGWKQYRKLFENEHVGGRMP